jgi:hypothetical protein
MKINMLLLNNTIILVWMNKLLRSQFLVRYYQSFFKYREYIFILLIMDIKNE